MKSRRYVPYPASRAKIVQLEHENALLKQENTKLRQLANVDPLTGLLNRRAFDEAFHVEVSRASRTGETITVVFVDLDHFKRINDTHGHPVGDEILCKLAHVLKDSCRKTDLIARMGGEEFAIVFTGESAVSNLAHVDKIRKIIKNKLIISIDDHPQICVTASFGMAESNGHHAIADLFKQADAALYRAKQSGRDRVIHSSLH